MKELLLLFTQKISNSPHHSSSEITDEWQIEALKKSYDATKNLSAEKFLIYDSYIPLNSLWNNPEYKKYVQIGSDTGEKMFNGFLKGFIKDYENIVLLNPCMGISQEIVEEAFYKFKTCEFVIGPKHTGNFYLLGMKKLNPFLFETYRESEKYFCKTVVNYFKKEERSYFELPLLKETKEENIFALQDYSRLLSLGGF